MSINTKHESSLQLHDLYVERMLFIRGGLRSAEEEQQLNVRITREDAYEDGKHGVKLSVYLTRDEDPAYKVELSIVGVFSFSGDLSEDVKESILKINTTSIIFPYLRSQLSLLTTQPGIQPIILPPMNISAMLEEHSDEENNSHE